MMLKQTLFGGVTWWLWCQSLAGILSWPCQGPLCG